MFPLENTDYSAADAQLWFATRLSGVYANNHLAVSAAGGMGVNIGKGIAWLHYGEFAGAVYGNTSEINLPILLADPTYPRIDRVVIRYDAVQNKGFLTISPGTPASNPAPAALLRNENAYEISLAKVYVSAGATEITVANITDERLDESVCGLMRDGVTGIDTSIIQAQAIASLEKVQDDAKEVLDLIKEAYNSAIDGTLAGNLQMQINQRPMLENLLIMFSPDGWYNDADAGTWFKTVSVDAYGEALDLDADTDELIVDVKIPNLYKDEVRAAWAELRDFEITDEGLKATFFALPSVNITITVDRFRKVMA